MEKFISFKNLKKSLQEFLSRIKSTFSVSNGNTSVNVGNIINYVEDVSKNNFGITTNRKTITVATQSDLATKQDKLTFDSRPIPNSNNPVTSDGIYNAIGPIDDLLDEIIGSNTIEEILDIILGEGTYNPIQKQTVIVAASGVSLNAETEKYYRFDNVVGTLAITLSHTTGNNIQMITFSLTTDSTFNITFTPEENTENVFYADGFQFEASSNYEINALWNGVNWIIVGTKLVGEE